MKKITQSFYETLPVEQKKFWDDFVPYHEKAPGGLDRLIGCYELYSKRTSPEFLAVYQEIMQKALEFFREHVDELEYAKGLTHLAHTYFVHPLGGSDYIVKAMELLTKAKEIQERRRNEPYLADTLIRMSECFIRSQEGALPMGDYEDAANYSRTAIELYKKHDFISPMVYAISILVIAVCKENSHSKLESTLRMVEQERSRLGFGLNDMAILALSRCHLLGHLGRKPDDEFLKELRYYLQELAKKNNDTQATEVHEEIFRYVLGNSVDPNDPQQTKKYIETILYNWKPEKELEHFSTTQLGDIINNILKLYHHFPEKVSPQEAMELIKQTLKKVFPLMADDRNLSRFTEFADIREHLLNGISHSFLDKGIDGEILLMLENYSRFHFKKNYLNMTYTAESPEKKLQYAKCNLLGNYFNILRRIQNMGDWQQNFDQFRNRFLSNRILFLADEKDHAFLKDLNSQIYQDLSSRISKGCSPIELMRFLQPLLSNVDSQKFSFGEANFLSIKDIEKIVKCYPKRVFIYLLLLDSDYRLIGIGAGYDEKSQRTIFQTNFSRMIGTEEVFQNFLSRNIGHAKKTPRAADQACHHLADAIRSVTQPWLDQGFTRITLIPFGNGPKIIPWENIPDKDGTRLIDIVEGISYCQSILCYQKPVSRRPGNSKFFFSGQSVNSPHRWGDAAMSFCTEKYTGEYTSPSVVPFFTFPVRWAHL